MLVKVPEFEKIALRAPRRKARDLQGENGDYDRTRTAALCQEKKQERYLRATKTPEGRRCEPSISYPAERTCALSMVQITTRARTQGVVFSRALPRTAAEGGASDLQNDKRNENSSSSDRAYCQDCGLKKQEFLRERT